LIDTEEKMWAERTLGPTDEIHGVMHFELADGNGWWGAHVREDGCVDLTRYYNFPFGIRSDDMPRPGFDPENADSIHICDVDDMIKRLLEIKALAQIVWGDDTNV